MKKKRNQCYLLLGTAIMLLLACLCSFVFVKNNLEQAAEKNEFESIYTDTSIDFIVPGPIDSQIEELENSKENGISVITPYYETTTPVTVNDTVINSTVLMFPIAEKITYTPYNSARIISGTSDTSPDTAIADQLFAEKYDCKIGDRVTINIADHSYIFEIQGVATTNTYYNNGTIALILSPENARQLATDGLKYSSAYISASDIAVCENYLYTEYKPLARLKDESQFDNDEAYAQHLANFNEADWSKEITNCQKNYQTLSVKYENIEGAILRNIAIMSIIVALVFIVFNMVLLTKQSMKNFMKAILIKKSGTLDSIKSFYRTGITANAITFCLASIGLYLFFVTNLHYRLIDWQLLNCIIPVVVMIIISAIMIRITGHYVDAHYKVRIIKEKDSTEKVHVEII